MEEICTFAPGLLLSFTALTLALISPGPSVLAILGVALGQGRPAAVTMAIGVASGTTCWALLTVLGLSALIAVSAQALLVIKVFGGCYLLWLAFKAFRAAMQDIDLTAEAATGPPRATVQHYLAGLAIHMTNPKAAFAWLSIAALGLQPDAPLWVPVTLVCGAAALSLSVNCFYALAFSSEPVFALYKRARRKIQVTLGVFFTVAGARLITQ